MEDDLGPILGFMLAGGLSMRMGGGDKCLRLLGGKTLLARIVERLGPQVTRLALNANGDPKRFAEYSLAVVPDSVTGFVGPLAGVLAGLDWAADNMPGCQFVVTVPTDAPFLPFDLVARLAASIRAGADMATASSSGQTHPVVGMWPVHLRRDLRHALTREDIRKVDRWTARYNLASVDFPADPVDPFFNANAPQDLAKAEDLLKLLERTANANTKTARQ
jgi:molybdenum cofactor guanylyltransferase